MAEAGLPRPEGRQVDQQVVGRLTDLFRQHGRYGPVVGHKTTRPVQWWAAVLSGHLAAAVTEQTIRAALAADSRASVAEDGSTNLRARRTLDAAGMGPGRGGR